MDATQRMVCQEDFFNPLTSMGMQMSCILVISHFFHLVLKTLGQPGPIAQIFAGLVLGPSGLSNVDRVRDFFFQASAAEYYEIFGFFCRMLFMFLIGLETDVSYIIRNIKASGTISYCGILIGTLFGVAVSFFLHQQLMFNDKKKLGFILIIILVLTYTASPVVIRLAGDLKFATSPTGRLAISCSLINEITCLVMFNLIIVIHKKSLFRDGFLAILITGMVILVNKYVAIWFNKRNRNQKYLRNAELLFILSVLIGSSMIIEMFTRNSAINCFLIGVMFPKEGKTARTLLQKLTYSVHNFILPIYFGYLGFQFDASRLGSLSSVVIVVILVVLSIGGKISGTLVACQYLRIPLNEGVFIGFCLNLKGHADLLFIGQATNSLIGWNQDAYNLLLISIVINTVISGPTLALLMRREENLFAQTSHTTLEFQNPEEDIRTLGCVYGPRHVSAILALISALNGSHRAPITPYVMHLIELTQKRRANVSYHELEDDELSDDEDYGGNDVVEINDAVDAFHAETKIIVHLSKAVSSFATLYEDVCNAAEDLRASIILAPFHKHQRIDGKMESGKEGVRTTNQKILRHAPCSVGIIAERGLAGVPGFAQLLDSATVQQVATLFFGGPDDREAVAWSKRIASHQKINLTVIRFLSTESSRVRSERVDDRDDVEVFMSLSSLETGKDVDNAFLSNFYNECVTSGQVGYVEKYVNNGAETVAAMRDIGDMYSLFIVGKGGRGHSPLTTGMSDWEECPELGTVGDLLASSEYNVNGSVLVIQQHRNSKKDLMDD
ncbi:DNA-directed DNA polymerase [Trema orientale]|uniref:DNA-directed DNA polymerase n=1 Tax=Trema orientale TaxID=63057 RepID=A0A2P5FZB1_TREOI|nr:DNA-directed DNA polymerase [Trema orientale]